MNQLFSRMKQAISADFHDLLDKKEKKNPIAMLNQYLRQCEAGNRKGSQASGTSVSFKS